MNLIRLFTGRSRRASASIVSPSASSQSLCLPSLFEKLESRQLLSTSYPPLAASNLTAASASSTSVSLKWSDNSTRETGYKVERSTDGTTFSQVSVVGANTVSFTDTGRTTGKKYYYRVRAYADVGGTSSPTNVASATPGSTTITPTPTPIPVSTGYTDGVSINTDID